MKILSVQSSKKRKFRNGQVDRQVFTVFEALKKRLDGQLANVLHEQRQSQYLADVNQENAERHRRTENVLDPGAPEIRDRWNANQVNNHEKLFPLGDNLITFDVYCRK